MMGILLRHLRDRELFFFSLIDKEGGRMVNDDRDDPFFVFSFSLF